jgi:hypothetical protein
VTEFVENIRRGYEPVAPLGGGRSELPEAATIAPWDGGDAQVRGARARPRPGVCARSPCLGRLDLGRVTGPAVHCNRGLASPFTSRPFSRRPWPAPG